MSGYKGNLNPAPRSSNPELSRDEEREADRAGNRANQGQRSSAQGEQQAGQRGPPGFQGQSQPAVGFARGRAFPTSQRGSGSALPSHFTMSSNFGGSYAAPPVSPFAGSSGSRPPAGSHNTITTGNPPTLAAPGRTFGYTLVPPIPMPNTLASAPLGYVTPTPAPLVPVSFVPVMLAPTPLAPASAVPAAIAVAAPAAVPVPAREVRLKTFNAPPGGTAAAGRGSTRVYSTTPEGPLRAPGHSCSDPECNCNHAPWATAGNLNIRACATLCEVCGHFRNDYRISASNLRRHVRDYHVIITERDEATGKLYNGVNTAAPP